MERVRARGSCLVHDQVFEYQSDSTYFSLHHLCTAEAPASTGFTSLKCQISLCLRAPDHIFLDWRGRKVLRVTTRPGGEHMMPNVIVHVVTKASFLDLAFSRLSSFC